MTTGLLLPLARQTSPLQEDDGLWPSSHLWLLRHDLLPSFSSSFFSSFSSSFSSSFFSTIGKTFLPAIIITRLDNAALIAQILHVADIIILFSYAQLIYVQTFAGISQTWSLGCLADFASLQKLDPFIQIVHRQLIKVVHAEQIILREYVSGFAIGLAALRDFITEEEFTLSVGELQDIIRLMESLEHRLAMIYIILSLPQCEIHDIDGIYLAHLVVKSSPKLILSVITLETP